MAHAGDRVLVFQPLYSYDAALDYRLLGIQYWIGEQLTAVGFEGVSALFAVPGADGKELRATLAPSDPDIRATLLEHGARYGLLTSFVVLADAPRLAVVRLVEAKRGLPLRVLLRSKTDDVEHLPAAAHRTAVAVASRLGADVRPSQWFDVFGTTDPLLASNYLTALGIYSACDMGVPIDRPELALRAAISGIQVGVGPHIHLFPQLVESLQRTRSADDDMILAAVSAALSVLPQPPPHWGSSGSTARALR